MSTLSTVISAGSASQVNETININSAENLITLADGRVYLKGGVNSTDLTTYPDATAGMAYSGTEFSISQVNQPASMTWDGNFFWVLNNTSTEAVHKYNASGVYQNVSWTTGNDPRGIIWDGNHFVVILSDGNVYKYNSSGVYANVTFSVANQTSSGASGIAWDGNSFWITDYNSDNVFKYNSSGVYQNFDFSVSSQDTVPRDITYDGTYLWVLGDITDKAYKYNTSGVYQNDSFSVGSQSTRAEGIVWVSSAFYVASYNNQKVFKYQNQIGIGSQGGTEYGNQNYVRIK